MRKNIILVMSGRRCGSFVMQEVSELSADNFTVT